MTSIPNYKNKIHTEYFNPKLFYGTMSNEEKAIRQNKKYYAKYKYLETKNKHRKVLLVTFTSKSKDINKIQEIKTKFLSFLKNDKNIKGSYSYIWSIELGTNKNNPHLHFMIWYDDSSYDRINLHYSKTLNKFNLTKKYSRLTDQRRVSAYVLKEFSFFNKNFEKYYVARKNMSKTLIKKIRYIGFSSFKHTDKIYKTSYSVYRYDYLKTEKYINFGTLIVWNKKYLIKNTDMPELILYLLLKYKNISQNIIDYQKFNILDVYYFSTLTISINKRIILLRKWEFPFVYIFT